jgi:hypothetical protein
LVNPGVRYARNFVNDTGYSGGLQMILHVVFRMIRSRIVDNSVAVILLVGSDEIHSMIDIREW